MFDDTGDLNNATVYKEASIHLLINSDHPDYRHEA
jgi:hypothetical protein